MGAKEELWVYVSDYMKAPCRNMWVWMLLANINSGNHLDFLRYACLSLSIIACWFRITGVMTWSIFPISESKDQFYKHKKLGKLHPAITIVPACKMRCPQATLICLSALLGIRWLWHSLVSAAGMMQRIQHSAWVYQAAQGSCSQMDVVRPGTEANLCWEGFIWVQHQEGCPEAPQLHLQYVNSGLWWHNLMVSTRG